MSQRRSTLVLFLIPALFVIPVPMKNLFKSLVAWLVWGVDTWDVASRLYESLAPERMRLLGLVLPTLDVSSCGRYASLAMTDDILRLSGASEEHTDGFVNYPRAIRGVEVALFFRQVAEEEYKVSFRSRGSIDVGSMARELGGGGHHNAAGAQVSGTLEDARAQVTRLLGRI